MKISSASRRFGDVRKTSPDLYHRRGTSPNTNTGSYHRRGQNSIMVASIGSTLSPHTKPFYPPKHARSYADVTSNKPWTKKGDDWKVKPFNNPKLSHSDQVVKLME